ncbi:MAG: rod shape-determining protein MreC [Thiovulaceae bacterium]|nr:rod shape-determining protein MreC [Sulfurimonadaceae bacterium]MCW9027117.1 rod shape-determining protein MreC [Sulfurimonadaceae bacterium]
MNKELLSFFLIFVALFLGAMYYTNIIQEPFISALNNVKASYHNAIEYASDNIERHFFQVERIDELNEKLSKYENNHLVMQQLASEVNDLFAVNKTRLRTNPKVELVRAISYKRFGDLNKLWIEMEDFNSSKIYGLTFNELVAGIVISDGNKPLAILNRDIKCTYAVYVGDKKAPGVANGNDEKNIMVEYIPSWFKIKKGDLVITSGLDDIFFKGLKVGTVLSITKSQGYQSAVVVPFYDSNEPSYFQLIKSAK